MRVAAIRVPSLVQRTRLAGRVDTRAHMTGSVHGPAARTSMPSGPTAITRSGASPVGHTAMSAMPAIVWSTVNVSASVDRANVSGVSSSRSDV